MRRGQACVKIPLSVGSFYNCKLLASAQAVRQSVGLAVSVVVANSSVNLHL